MSINRINSDCQKRRAFRYATGTPLLSSGYANVEAVEKVQMKKIVGTAGHAAFMPETKWDYIASFDGIKGYCGTEFPEFSGSGLFLQTR